MATCETCDSPPGGVSESEGFKSEGEAVGIQLQYHHSDHRGQFETEMLQNETNLQKNLTFCSEAWRSNL